MKRHEAAELLDGMLRIVFAAKNFRELTLRELSRETGVSVPTLSRCQRGGLPDALTLVKLMVWARGASAPNGDRP